MSSRPSKKRKNRGDLDLSSEGLYLIDASAPFFARKKNKSHTNWSKAPTHELLRKGKVSKKVHKKIREGMLAYARRVRSLGYNALSIDEASYLIYEEAPDQKKSIQKYRKYYGRLFDQVLDLGLAPFLTADIWFGVSAEQYRRRSEALFGGSAMSDRRAFFAHVARLLDNLLADFPQLAGMIFRMGESDGVDVQSPFRSQIVLRDPRDMQQFLQSVLPVFEKHRKMMIFRTWTVGAGKLGDLLWNQSNLQRCIPDFAAKSDYFLLSHKFSQSDFLRMQPLNSYCTNLSIPFILELQTRREYEGFGEFPCFVGFDYEEYSALLRRNPWLKGIHVWCQTGGWSRFRNISFLKRSSFWNELNTAVTVRLFRNKETVVEALQNVGFKKRLEPALELLRLSDELIRQVMYVPSFARRSLFLNRSRIPPLVHVLWDRITITPMVALLYRLFGEDLSGDLARMEEAAGKIERMKSLAKKAGMPYDHRFHRSTFRLFYFASRYLMLGLPEDAHQLKEVFAQYHKDYPDAYQLQLQELPGADGPELARERSLSSMFLRWLMGGIIRTKPGYRWIDRVLFHSWIRFLVLWSLPLWKKQLPDALDEQAMAIAEFFE